ncbi:hypothetical protein N9L68_05650, partial [bacterium]|nr:hypothetical protein [bacterium]
DSSAAKSMASRKGVGKVRHLAVRFLWLQQAVRDGRLCIRKILGTLNPSDILTKPKTLADLSDLLGRIGCKLVTGILEEARGISAVLYASRSCATPPVVSACEKRKQMQVLREGRAVERMPNARRDSSVRNGQCEGLETRAAWQCEKEDGSTGSKPPPPKALREEFC